MNNEQLVVINPKDFGLEKTEAQKIEEVFTPMLEKMTCLEKEYNKIISLELSQESIKMARELRLKYVKLRTNTDEIHKKAKSYYLAGGRFVDAWKNAQKFSSIGKEEELEKIEKHYERIEEERKEKLNQERITQLSKYVEDTSFFNLKEMSEQGFQQLLKTSKDSRKAEKEAELKAEEERVTKEKLKEEEDKKIREENAKLRKEVEDKERIENELKEIKDKEKEEAEQKDKAEKAEKEAEDRLEKETLYKEFLNDNEYNNKTKHLFHIEKVGNEIKLYKIISIFNLK